MIQTVIKRKLMKYLYACLCVYLKKIISHYTHYRNKFYLFIMIDKWILYINEYIKQIAKIEPLARMYEIVKWLPESVHVNFLCQAHFSISPRPL